jgi:hypothetical protein
MPQTVRKYWGPFQGRVTLNLNWDAINHDSVVLVTASEYQVTTLNIVTDITVLDAAPVEVQV